MEALIATVSLLQQQWAYFTFYDAIEILFFASTLYAITLWLKQDRQQPLVGYFYAYLGTALASYFFGLFAISYTLFAISPVAAMVFVLVHQKTLQRNYVTLQNLHPKKPKLQDNWIELLVRSCLVAMNNEKPVTCIIEQRDSLHQFIWTSFVLDAFVQPGLIELLLQTTSYDKTSFLWLTGQGKLHAIGCRWQQLGDQDDAAMWHEDALLYTSNTDAVVMHADPTTHSFSIIAQSKLIDSLSAPQAVRILTSYIGQKSIVLKGAVHNEKPKTNTVQQSTP